MGQIFNDEADMLAYPLQRTIGREQIFDLSASLYDVECNVLYRKPPDRISSWWNFFTVSGAFDRENTATIMDAVRAVAKCVASIAGF